MNLQHVNMNECASQYCGVGDQMLLLCLNLKSCQTKFMGQHNFVGIVTVQVYICKCDLHFFFCINRLDLKEHLTKHSSSRQFECQLCGEGFQHRRQMDHHHKQAHDKKKKRRHPKSCAISAVRTDKYISANRGKTEKGFSCNLCNRYCVYFRSMSLDIISGFFVQQLQHIILYIYLF